MSKGHLALTRLHQALRSASAVSTWRTSWTAAVSSRCRWHSAVCWRCLHAIFLTPALLLFPFGSFYSVASPFLSSLVWVINAPPSPQLPWVSLIVSCIVLHHCGPHLQYLHLHNLSVISCVPLSIIIKLVKCFPQTLVYVNDFLVNYYRWHFLPLESAAKAFSILSRPTCLL